MNLQAYRARLTKLEEDLNARIRHFAEMGRDQFVDVAADAGDEGEADENAASDFSQAERDTAMLDQVKAALRRIDDGTFGQCVVDGGPIEVQRLEALPWTPYCSKHERMREVVAPPRTPTL